MSIQGQGVEVAASAGTNSRELRRLMDERGLHVVYQPILDVRQGLHFACEALIRGPENSALHTPAALFAAAASERWTHELEWMAVETAILNFAEQHCALRLCLNMSIGCLYASHKRLVALHQNLQRLGVAPSQIVIELTGNEPVTNFSDLQETLRHFRGIGIQIAIDNMGKGFSNLRMWSEVRPEFVKVDRYFVWGIDTDPLKRHFVRTMNSIAEAGSSTLIAEGVETAAQLAVLTDIGIAYLQGFGIARPHQVIPPTLRGTHLTAAQEDIPDRPLQAPPKRSRPRIEPLLHHTAVISHDTGDDALNRVPEQLSAINSAPKTSLATIDAEHQTGAANGNQDPVMTCSNALCHYRNARMMPQTGAKQTPIAPISLAMRVATVSSY